MTRPRFPADKAAPRRGQATFATAAAIAGCLLAAGGCALSSHESGSKDMLFDRDGVDIVTTTASRQMVMIKGDSSTERYCRGPEPDSSLAVGGGVSLSMPLASGTKSIGGEKHQEAIALGGRNPAVLITRELLYRACELSMNLNADAVSTLAIYREFLAIAQAIAATQRQDGTQATASTKADPSKGDSPDDDAVKDDDDKAAGDSGSDGGKAAKDKGKPDETKKKP